MRTIGKYMQSDVQTLGEPAVRDLLAYLNDSLADEEDGMVDSYGGHLARVGAMLLLTDSDGCHHAMLALGTEGVTRAVVAHLIMARHRLYREHAETLAGGS